MALSASCPGLPPPARQPVWVLAAAVGLVPELTLRVRWPTHSLWGLGVPSLGTRASGPQACQEKPLGAQWSGCGTRPAAGELVVCGCSLETLRP